MKHLKQTLSLLLLTLFSLVTVTQAAEITTYYHNDLLGSPIAATDETGKVIWRESYFPHGERTEVEPKSSTNEVWFTGKPEDRSGLIYMNARYYDPIIGRFMSLDPAGFTEANLKSANGYQYANQNPYKYVDPDGRNPLAILFGLWVASDIVIPTIMDDQCNGCAIPAGFPLDVSVVASAAKGISSAARMFSGSVGRFTEIGSGLSKADARVLIRSGNSGFSEGQAASILKKLGKGRVDSVGIKTVNQSGNVRLTLERAGAQSGFQRFSFDIGVNGRTLRTVQTAFDDSGNLVRQAPGAAKNNLFDVK